MFLTIMRTLTPPKMQKCDKKFNLRQNTVFSFTNFTQTLKILHHPGWFGDIFQVWQGGVVQNSAVH